MPLLARLALSALFMLAPVLAGAQEASPAPPPTSVSESGYVGVAADAAILYDGPSAKAGKRFVVTRGTPLQQISTLGRWRKVQDFEGGVFWIDASAIGPARYVIVSRALGSVRRSPRPVGELLFQVQRGVLLEVIDEPAPAGWLAVRHRDGARGFVATGDVWGRD